MQVENPVKCRTRGSYCRTGEEMEELMRSLVLSSLKKSRYHFIVKSGEANEQRV